MSERNSIKMDAPLPPERAAKLADDPRFDPLERVHMALDAGFEDPDFTQEEAARLAGMGTRRLRHLLAKHDSSYRIEVDRRRMRKAEQLLVDTKFLISAVGRLCGYRNTSAFCKRFKEVHLVTPMRYRVGRKGGPKRAGGPTGASKSPAARTRAREEGRPIPSTRRMGWGPGEAEANGAEWDHAVRQGRAFGLLPRHASISFEEMRQAREQKRRRGAAS